MIVCYVDVVFFLVFRAVRMIDDCMFHVDVPGHKLCSGVLLG